MLHQRGCFVSFIHSCSIYYCLEGHGGWHQRWVDCVGFVLPYSQGWMNDGTFLGNDFANAIVIANSGAGGDVDSAIFAKAKELNATYKTACDFYRTRNHKYRQVVLENYDYDSSIVRSNELHRARLFMMRYELSKHSAQDIMRKRLKAGEGDNLDKHKTDLCYLGVWIYILG